MVILHHHILAVLGTLNNQFLSNLFFLVKPVTQITNLVLEIGNHFHFLSKHLLHRVDIVFNV